MRCNLDVGVLVSTGSGTEDRKDMCHWCVIITVDESEECFYWSQKGPSKGSQRRVLRGKIDKLTQVQTLFDTIPGPIDLGIRQEHTDYGLDGSWRSFIW